MLIATAVARGVGLETAAEEVASKRADLAERTMDVIFQSQRAEEDADERTGRLRERLNQLLGDPDVVRALEDCGSVLWSEPDAGLIVWLQECYASSLGAVLFDAVTSVARDIDPDDLTVDVERDTIWIAEQTPGGVGLVQRIAEAITRRPRDLDMQLLDTLRHCDRELLASQLSTVARLVGHGDAALAAAFSRARRASDLRGQANTLKAIGAALEPHGLPATRDLVVALNSKFLRPSSGPDSDDLVAALAADGMMSSGASGAQSIFASWQSPRGRWRRSMRRSSRCWGGLAVATAFWRVRSLTSFSRCCGSTAETAAPTASNGGSTTSTL